MECFSQFLGTNHGQLFVHKRDILNIDVKFFQQFQFESCLFCDIGLVLDTYCCHKVDKGSSLEKMMIFIHDLKFGEIGQMQQQHHTGNIAPKVKTTNRKL